MDVYSCMIPDYMLIVQLMIEADLCIPRMKNILWKNILR